VGQQWALLGPNGAGKTTLAKLLTGQLVGASGDIALGDKLTDEGIAYVSFEEQKQLQDHDRRFDDSETRASAFDAGTRAIDAILQGQEPPPEFAGWVEQLQMSHILGRGIRFTSTGEMRKILLLRALVSRPALIILDSPMDGLDLASQRELHDLIDSLLDSHLNSGPRILLLCRDLRDLPAGVSHVMVLTEGGVAGAGPRADTLAQEAVIELMEPELPGLAALPPPAVRPYELSATEPRVVMEDVHVSYYDNTVLNGVNWRLDAGQHCAIAGPNGCGKTTLLSLINGDNHKAYGQNITLFGRLRGSGESVWDIKQKFGGIDTQLQLNHVRGMNAIEVVVSGFFDTIGLYDDWGDQQRATAQQWLAALGIPELESQPFDDLSSGLQRMVLLARAMVKSPAILILDEPCLGLDSYHRRLILQAADHIAENSDTQILFVSHSRGEAPNCINQWLDFVPGDTGYTVSSKRGT
jgi:molybdate transport system ATP-binding protein